MQHQSTPTKTLESVSPASVGDKVRRLRMRLRWSQRHLSEVTGLSRSYICDIEKGRAVNMSAGLLRRLAAALDVEPGVFLTDDPSPGHLPSISAELNSVMIELVKLSDRISRLQERIDRDAA